MRFHAQKNLSFWTVFLTDFCWSYKEDMSEWNKKYRFFYYYFSPSSSKSTTITSNIREYRL